MPFARRARITLAAALLLAGAGGFVRVGSAQETKPAPRRLQFEELKKDWDDAQRKHYAAQSELVWIDHQYRRAEETVTPLQEELKRLTSARAPAETLSKAQEAVRVAVVETKYAELSLEHTRTLNAEKAARETAIERGWALFRELSRKIDLYADAIGQRIDDEKKNWFQQSVDLLRQLDALEKLPVAVPAAFPAGATDEVNDPSQLEGIIAQLDEDAQSMSHLQTTLSTELEKQRDAEHHLVKYSEALAMMDRTRPALTKVRSKISELEKARDGALLREKTLRAEVERAREHKRQLEDGVSRRSSSSSSSQPK